MTFLFKWVILRFQPLIFHRLQIFWFVHARWTWSQVAIMGRSDKKAVWLMSRHVTLETNALQKMREHLHKCGNLVLAQTWAKKNQRATLNGFGPTWTSLIFCYQCLLRRESVGRKNMETWVTFFFAASLISVARLFFSPSEVIPLPTLQRCVRNGSRHLCVHGPEATPSSSWSRWCVMPLGGCDFISMGYWWISMDGLLETPGKHSSSCIIAGKQAFWAQASVVFSGSFKLWDMLRVVGLGGFSS